MKNKKFYMIIMTLLLVVSMLPLSMTNAEAANKVKLNYKKVTMNVGKTKRLKVKGTKKKVQWKSSRKSVATVSKKGVVKAKKKGTATITAQIGKKKLRCKVVVKKNSGNNKNGNNAAAKRTYVGTPSSSPRFSYIDGPLTKGMTIDLTEYSSGGSGWTNAQRASLFKWSSSDNNVVSVNKYGYATANGAGTAKITVKILAYSGWKTSSFKLTVNDMDGIDIKISRSLSDQSKYDSHLSFLKMTSENPDEYDEKNVVFDTVTIQVKNNSTSNLILDSSLIHDGV